MSRRGGSKSNASIGSRSRTDNLEEPRVETSQTGENDKTKDIIGFDEGVLWFL